MRHVMGKSSYGRLAKEIPLRLYHFWPSSISSKPKLHTRQSEPANQLVPGKTDRRKWNVIGLDLVIQESDYRLDVCRITVERQCLEL